MQTNTPTTAAQETSVTPKAKPLTVRELNLWLKTPEGQEHLALKDRAAERMRATHSCVPFYKEQADEEEARTGDPLAFWRSCPGIYGEMNTLRELEAKEKEQASAS